MQDRAVEWKKTSGHSQIGMHEGVLFVVGSAGEPRALSGSMGVGMGWWRLRKWKTGVRVRHRPSANENRALAVSEWHRFCCGALRSVTP